MLKTTGERKSHLINSIEIPGKAFGNNDRKLPVVY